MLLEAVVSSYVLPARNIERESDYLRPKQRYGISCFSLSAEFVFCVPSNRDNVVTLYCLRKVSTQQTFTSC